MLGERWEWAAFSLALALVNYAALPAPRWTKPESRLASTPGVTVVWANVWNKREALRRTLDWAKSRNADLILIGEYPDVDPATCLLDDYPYRVDTGLAPAGTYLTRITVFSRIPLDEIELPSWPGPHHRPWTTFGMTIDGKKLAAIVVHPPPPYTPKLLRERDTHIAALAAHVREPFVLAGDFNATPWCPVFKSIPGRRVGDYLFKPTWFTGLPLLGLPIDHIMTSPALKASAYEVAKSTGSDHRAILARIHP
ncbi:MAG: endonuclease/exonuclease/phosphatase family protein [Burkholderiales bacterium]|nr:MAG: endonuclease/exonuclease/phosphatase family protein [Burkholderiales bacterium]